MNALITRIQQIVGQANVLVDGDLGAYEQDWRKRQRGKALCVVRPGSTEEVAQVVLACAQYASVGVSIVPQGGNTGLVVGGVPDDSGMQVVLSLQRMNRICNVDAANMTLTVEAGCVLQNVQDAAREAGFLFPLSLAAEGSCTIGGNLATNAGGTQVLRFGNARDLCLGLEVVTANGDVLHGLSGLRKDNTGYALKDLLIGSEGTLGIITAATLKLYPQPAASLTAWVAVPTLDSAVQLLSRARQTLSAALTGFEVMNQFSLGLVDRHFPPLAVPLYRDSAWCVLLENADSESEAHARERLENLLGAALDDGTATDAVIAENIAQSRKLWHIRESIPLAQAEEGLNIKHDISLPISRIGEYVAQTDAALQAALPGVRLVNFGHLGDGNLHYNVQCPEGVDAKQFLATHEKQVNTIVYDAVKNFGGSISAEHGIGSLKVDELPHYKDAVALSLMRAVKRALDPHKLLNPGRVIQL